MMQIFTQHAYAVYIVIEINIEALYIFYKLLVNLIAYSDHLCSNTS